MTDFHIHIGQFYDIWYDPLEIAQIVLEGGCEACLFSSTTSCTENIRYAQVEAEIDALLAKIALQKNRIAPLLWYAPDYAKQGVDITKAMHSLPYSGIKIHPRAHNWNQNDPKIVSLLHELFEYADAYCLPVWIHTGYDTVDNAMVFADFFGRYAKASFILAHCRPLESALHLLGAYANVYCDTAFVPEDALKIIIAKGFSKKILFGSDFPITHYFAYKYSKISLSNTTDAWQEQYTKDKMTLNFYTQLIKEGAHYT